MGIEETNLPAETGSAVTESTKFPSREFKTKGPKNEQINFLNGLRGYAALIVVTCHAGYLSSATPKAELGVDTFFVLSAFLLTYQLFEKFDQLDSWQKFKLKLKSNVDRLKRFVGVLVVFMIKRFMRVYPMFALVAIIMACLPKAMKDDFGWVNFNLIGVLTFKMDQRFGILWTIPLELAYYFMIPPFVLLMRQLTTKYRLILNSLILVGLIPCGILIRRTNNQDLWPHLPTFITGSVYAIYHLEMKKLKVKNEDVFKLSKKVTIPIDILGYILALLVQSLYFNRFLFSWVFPYVPREDTNRFSFTSALVGLLILKEIHIPSGLSRFFEWNFFVFCGKVSYPLYLFHPLMAQFVAGIEKDWYNRVFIVYFGSIAIAAAGHYILEKPLIARATRMLCNWVDRRLITNPSYLRSSSYLSVHELSKNGDQNV